MRRTRVLQHGLGGEALERRACPTMFMLTPVVDFVSEGEAALFRVAIDAPSDQLESVVVSTAKGTATLGVDYLHEVHELVFSPGETEKTFQIQTLSDPSQVSEGLETFVVSVTPQNGWQEELTASVTIYDAIDANHGGGRYDIDFAFDVGVSDSVQSLFYAAARLWESVIIGDVPDVTLPDGSVIDDLLIHVDVADLDDGVIALAGITDIRLGNTGRPANGGFAQDGLPYIGQMTINAAFQSAIGLGTTIAHEIGHVIGFGTLWQSVGSYTSLVAGIGTDDPVYVGANAVREFNQIFGASGESVPLFEVSTVGEPEYEGSYGCHWRDSVFNNYPMFGELMTSSYPVNGDDGAVVPAVLSRVTVGVLEDLGYVVDYMGAEYYRAPGIADVAPILGGAASGDVPGPVLVGVGSMGPDGGLADELKPRERRLPPRITSRDAAPLILANTDESRAELRESLAGYYAGEMTPINFADLAADQLAMLAAWAEFERAMVWDLVSAARDDDGMGDDALYGDPGAS